MTTVTAIRLDLRLDAAMLEAQIGALLTVLRAEAALDDEFLDSLDRQLRRVLLRIEHLQQARRAAEREAR